MKLHSTTRKQRKLKGLLNSNQQLRLATIRGSLEKHRALGLDVSSWESEFFLGIIDRFAERLKRAKG